ncbi:MAG: pyruvate, phosphate dikinase [Magnetococcales bacterium]|nr:pyruvate, phosphate dikinase [Magnetococcales bacterium]
MTKWVYFFGGGKADGAADQKNLLGGKGANLAEMNRLGLPVPAGFTLSTDVCTYYYAHQRHYPEGLTDQVNEALRQVESMMGGRFGDPVNPLLLSVRSGARKSMPGMMETVLNVGLCSTTIPGLIAKTGNPRFVYDAYRRLIMMYSDVVMEKAAGVEPEEGKGIRLQLDHMLETMKKARGCVSDADLTAEDLQELVGRFKVKVKEVLGRDFPDDPVEQMWGGIGAVFASWNGKRAIAYRKIEGIPHEWGTAVNVQSMVFGNMGENSATGVAFSRDPSNGEKRFYGEYLINAQGEDVVAGIRTPQQVTIEGRKRGHSDLPSLEETMPPLYGQLVEIYHRLEAHYRDMQDIEFTIQEGRLWMLQCRVGKRTAPAAIKIAVDMVNEGMITKEEAINRVDPAALDQLLHPMLDPKAPKTIIAKGLAASPGAASGRVMLTADEAERAAEKGEAVILVREETSPEDIHGMHAAKGIVTVRGGMTSHAAVVARGMGRPCVSGCGDLQPLHIDFANKRFEVNGQVVNQGDWITIDGGKGHVMLGKVPTLDPELSGDFGQFMEWADSLRRMKVRANADTPQDAQVARRFGAEGIGLCRTEHMFFDGERIVAMREMILAHDVVGRRKALAKILPMQRGDFEGLFREMKGLPVTIRLLDPPLHEFIPHDEKGQAEMARTMEVSLEEVKRRVDSLKEFNPMLGHRGCRLGITYPEIYEMQVQAIMEAACGLVKREQFSIAPEIMIPLVGHVTELKYLTERCIAVCNRVMEETGVTLDYLIGTMIELPRAALAAAQIAQEAQFFSFGTNDLTQTTLGISRDDAGSFLTEYVGKGLIKQDPFVSIDQGGVGKLVKMAVADGQSARPGLKLGVCGEHGGDPASIHFFEEVGLHYVSCSPYRVPIARLAAAQAALARK